MFICTSIVDVSFLDECHRAFNQTRLQWVCSVGNAFVDVFLLTHVTL